MLNATKKGVAIFLSLLFISSMAFLPARVATIEVEESGNNGIFVNSSQTTIPSKAVEYNGNYYCYYDGTKTWDSAESACEALGGHLVTITDQNEQNFILSYISSGASDAYWIGGKFDYESQVMRWVTNEDFNFENWGASGQPAHAYYDPASYVAIARNTITGWVNKDMWCDFCYYDCGGYICEWETKCEEKPTPTNYGDFEYITNDDNTVEITKYLSNDDAVEIPS